MKRFTTGEKTGMAYFPIMINLENRAVLIIGGGATALRKAETMLSYGAKVFVIAKEFKHEFPKAAVLKEKEFEDEDLLLKARDFFLVIVATGDGEVNAHISELCKKERILVNAVDEEEKCSFIFPAIYRQGDVVVSASSSGKSPLVTQYLRDRISKCLPENIGEINDEMGKLRNRIRQEIHSQKERKEIYKKALEEMLKE